MQRHYSNFEIKRFNLLSHTFDLFPYSCGDVHQLFQQPENSRRMSYDCSVGKQTPFFVKSICGRRKYMEDRYSIIDNIVPGTHFLGVYDGHGGPDVAEGCVELIGASVKQCILQQKMKNSEALVTALLNADERDLTNWGADLHIMGTTATIALIGPHHITVANVGDSAAYMLRNVDSRIIPLSRQHTPALLDERKRILLAGGTIRAHSSTDKTERVQGILSVTRAIGDHALRPYVSSQPEVIIVRHHPGDICIVATDGLWDVMTPKEALQITIDMLKISGNTPSEITSFITQMAVERKTKDNITVIIALL